MCCFFGGLLYFEVRYKVQGTGSYLLLLAGGINRSDGDGARCPVSWPLLLLLSPHTTTVLLTVCEREANATIKAKPRSNEFDTTLLTLVVGFGGWFL